MSALTGDRLKLRRVTKSPRELTSIRHRTEKIIGRKIAVPKKEIDAYKKAGLKPPTS